MTDKEKIQVLFNELNLPFEPASWADNTPETDTYQILNGVAYFTFDSNGKIAEYHGGYE